MTVDLTSYGSRLRKARRDLGLSQAEASAGIITASFMSLIEAGKRMPSQAVAEALAQRLGITTDASIGYSSVTIPDFAAALAAVHAGDTANAELRAAALPPRWPGRQLIDALVAELRGELTDATLQLVSALAQTSVGSELWLEIASALCRVAFNAGNVTAAIDAGEAALAIPEFASARCEDLALGIRASLSSIYCESGNLARAKELTEDPAVQPSTPWQRGTQMWARSIVATVEGRVQDAESLATEALRLFQGSDRPLSVARLQVNAAMLKLQTPDFDVSAVRQLLEPAERAFRTIGSPFDLAGCLSARARFAALVGDASSARTLVEESLLLVSDEGVGLRARIYASAGLTFMTIDDRRNAEVHLLEARRLLESAGASRAAAATWRQLASAYENLGQLDLALACMKAATDLLGVHPTHSTPIRSRV